MDKYEAIGYMLLAMKESGIEDLETIKTVMRNMAYCIDSYTETYAENEGERYLKSLERKQKKGC